MSTTASSLLRFPFRHLARAFVPVIAVLACSDAAGPSDPPGFLAGTRDDPQIALVVNSTGKALTMFQLGSPSTQRVIPLGTSSTITAEGVSIRGRSAVVPLGNAASAALVDLESATIARYFTFPSGNATGVAFADDSTIILANPSLGIVGRVTTGQSGDPITDTVRVAPFPTAVTVSGARALVTSSNIDESFEPLGNGVVTALDTRTLEVLGSVETGGTNSSAAALGPDGLLYVLNTGDFVSEGSMTIIDPATMRVDTTIQNMGVGPGAISIDAGGLAYISSFFAGTIVWNTRTRAFVRAPGDPVCARLQSGDCRGAFSAAASANGDVYQVFFGSASKSLAPYVFVYRGSALALSDSVPVGTGPTFITIRTF